MAMLLDTGAIYALADVVDVWHKRMTRLITSTREELLAPATVITEACYLLRKRLGLRHEAHLVTLVAAGEIALLDLTRADLWRCAELMRVYDFLGFVDASLVAVAERLKLPALVTTDRRDFSRVRPAHVSAFQLLP